MTTQEIARKEWRNFFRGFSQQHDGWLVTLEIMGSELGAQIQGRELQLRGLSPETAQDDSDVALMLETGDGDHLTHVISTPAHIWVERAPDGADMALEIQSADKTSTLIRFRSAMRPEMVDGIPQRGDLEAARKKTS